MRPFKKSKKTGRIGNNPLDNVVGESAGVRGQQVQPGKGPQMTGQTGVVKVGQSSSYNVSSGLVNALDVVQGVGQTMQGLDKVGNMIDDSRLSEMQKKIQTMRSSDEWSNPENEGYLNDEAKLSAIGGVQKEYEGGWLNDTYRAKYEESVASTKIASQTLDFNGAMAWASRSRATQLALGVDPALAQSNTDKIYEKILADHGKDAQKSEQIKSAQLGDAAMWAQSVSEGAQNTVAAWEASGGLDRLHSTLPSDVGYEEWEQTALAAMAQYGGEGGAALWNSYNKGTGKFDSPYADMLSQTLRRTLEPVYNKSVQMQVADSDLQQRHTVAQAPKTSAVDFVSATDPTVGNARVGDGFGRMMSGVTAGMRSLTNTQRQPLMGDFLGKTSVSAFQMDATMTTERAAEMMNSVAVDKATEIAAFVGMDVDSKEFATYLEDQVKVGMSTFRAVKQQAANEQDRTGAFVLTQGEPSFDPQVVKENISKHLFVGAIDKGGSVNLSVLDSDSGKPFTASDPNAQAFGQMGLNFIIAASMDKEPDVRREQLAKFAEYYAGYINSDAPDPSLLVDFLGKVAEDGPWNVSLSKDGGNISFSMTAEARADPATLTNAKVGAMLPYLQTDDDGFFTPLGNPAVVHSTLKGAITAGAMTENGKLSPDFVDQATKMAAMSRSIFPGITADSVAADVILSGLSDVAGEYPTGNRQNLSFALRKALEDGDNVKVAEIMDGVIQGRAGTVLTRDIETMTYKEFSPEVSAMMGGASFLSTSGKVQEEGGSWFFGLGMSDSAGAERAATMNKTSAHRVMQAGLEAGVFRYDPETNQTTLMDPDADNVATAGAINKALNASGYQWNHETNDEGETVAVNIIDTPVIFEGTDLKPGRPDMNYSGDWNDVMGAAFEVEQWEQSHQAMPTQNKNIALGGMGIIEAMFPFLLAKETTGGSGRFYETTHDQIVSTGRSSLEADNLMKNPDFRRLYADNGRQARTFFTNDAGVEERMAFSNQIHETLTSFSEEGILDANDPEVAERMQNVRDIASALESGTLRGNAPIWEKVTQVAKNQGYSLWRSNPPMWALKIAIMQEILPDQAEVIGMTSPFDLKTDRAFPFGVQREGLRDSQRGYDTNISFTLDNFSWLGKEQRNIRIPIFASSMVGNKSKGDPRTLMNTEAGRRKIRGVVREDQYGKGDNKYQQIHSPDAASARSGGPTYRRDGGTGSTSKPTRFE